MPPNGQIQKQIKKIVPKKKKEIEEENEKIKELSKGKSANNKTTEELPEVKIEFKSMEMGNIELSSTLPDFSAEKYIVPIVTPEFVEIQPNSLVLDDTFEKLEIVKYPTVYILPEFKEPRSGNINLVDKVPKFTGVEMYPIIYVFPNFNTILPRVVEKKEILLGEELPEGFEAVIMEDVKIRHKKIDGVSVINEGLVSNLKTFEDFMEETQRKEWYAGSLVLGERPTVIWIGEKKLTPLLKIMARELYRIKMGGLPRSHHYDVLAEPFHGAVEDITADKSVFVVGEEAINKIFKKKNGEEDIHQDLRDLFLSKMESLYAHRGGFILVEMLPIELTGNNNRKNMKKLELKNASYKELTLLPNTILDTESFNEHFIKLFGFESKSKYDTVYMYGQIDKKYHDSLETLASDAKYAIWVKPSRGDEALLHYALKIFTFKYLVEKRKLDINKISVEKQITEEYIPDIMVPEAGTVYEIETFYGRGFGIARNLLEKVEKANNARIDTIHFVISPLHYFVIGKYISKILGKVKENYRNVRIYLDIPNFTTGKFRHIEIKEGPAVKSQK